MADFLTSLRAYRPLIVVVLLAIVLPFVITQEIDAMTWMHQSMGFFLVILSMFKLFDLQAFKRGFLKYDPITQRFPGYGLVYPFIELALGLAYLAQCCLVTTYIATIIVMSVGGIGVVRSIRQGLKLNCACMGNVLQVPLSTVSIIENFGMTAMAAVMLVITFI